MRVQIQPVTSRDDALDSFDIYYADAILALRAMLKGNRLAPPAKITGLDDCFFTWRYAGGLYCKSADDNDALNHLSFVGVVAGRMRGNHITKCFQSIRQAVKGFIVPGCEGKTVAVGRWMLIDGRAEYGKKPHLRESLATYALMMYQAAATARAYRRFDETITELIEKEVV